MARGSRLFCAICRAFKLQRMGRTPVHNFLMLDDSNETAWLETVWPMGEGRFRAITFGGHHFSKTRAVRDIMVVNKGLDSLRRRSRLPARFGGGAKLLVDQYGQLLPLQNAAAMMAPLQQIPPTAPADPVRASPPMAQAPEQADSHTPVAGSHLPQSSSHGPAKRQSVQYQPAHSSGLRHSMTATSNDNVAFNDEGDSPAHSSRPQRLSTVTPVIKSRSSTSSISSSFPGFGERQAALRAGQVPQTPPQSRPASTVVESTQDGIEVNGRPNSRDHRHNIPPRGTVAPAGGVALDEQHNRPPQPSTSPAARPNYTAAQ